MQHTMAKSASSARGLTLGRRRRSRRSRALSALALLLIFAGTLALLDGIVTLAWQEPFSALYARLRQNDLAGKLHKLEQAPATPVQQRTLASLADQRERIAYLAREAQHQAVDGAAAGRIEIPRVGANFVVVEGTDTDALRSGPGLYPQTGFPGIPGTTAIAGHRTTYLAPFRHVDALRPGDQILLQMPYAHFTYTVIGSSVVAPTDVQAAVADLGYSRLVLSACTPLFSAAKRLLVYARLTVTVPEGAARTLPGGALPRPIESTSAQPLVRPPLPAVLESGEPHLIPPLV